ncbi:MAG: hypothetical protein IPJ65_23215 [Archangiaceae bacterium]|nr:hypothetical protein [Archangiaceae bacterium]
MEGLTLLLAVVAAQADGGLPAPEETTVLVRRLDANEGASDLVPGLSSLMTERVKSANVKFKVYSQADLERVISIERQQQLIGCADESCLTELAGALGARFIVSGRLDRFGDRYVLVAGLYDSNSPSTSVQSRREVTDPGRLPAALDEVADDVLAPLGVEKRVTTNLAGRYDTTGFSLGIKFSTQFVSSLVKLAPGGEIELAYRITPGIVAFFELSFIFTLGEGSTQLFPGVLGARYYFRNASRFQPYLGAGIGLLVAIRALQGQTRPNLWAHTGASYLFFPWLGALLEFGVDILGAAFDLFENQRTGVNLALSIGVLFRF